jgi:hypothetical protein
MSLICTTCSTLLYLSEGKGGEGYTLNDRGDSVSISVLVRICIGGLSVLSHYYLLMLHDVCFFVFFVFCYYLH